MTGLTPLGRLGHPAEVVAGVAYLASDDASFVTGLELYIDGGYMAR
jgi:NAD(P)-dependent dehydrogenase (short-subunit alcohol dehydrogenase family)